MKLSYLIVIILCLSFCHISYCQQKNKYSKDTLEIINQFQDKGILLSICAPTCSGCVKVLSSFFKSLNFKDSVKLVLYTNECIDNYDKRMYLKEYQKLFPKFNIVFSDYLYKKYPFTKDGSNLLITVVNNTKNIIKFL